MAGLDDLIAQIPIQDIASKLGVDSKRSEQRGSAVGAGPGRWSAGERPGSRRRRQDRGAADKHAASGLIDGGVTIDQVDAADGDKIVAKIFGGNNSGRWRRRWPAAARAAAGWCRSCCRSWPRSCSPTSASSSPPERRRRRGGSRRRRPPVVAALGDVLGGILRRAGGGGGSNPLGSILGSVLGGGRVAADRRNPRRPARRQEVAQRLLEAAGVGAFASCDVLPRMTGDCQRPDHAGWPAE